MAISGEHKLKIYNGALRRLGSRQLASLTESREPRRVLDGAWGSGDDAVIAALEKGEWNFAVRAVKVDYSTDVIPQFGFRRAFVKPADFLRLAGLAANESFKPPLTDDEYIDEAGNWLSGYDVIYVRYVSSDYEFGRNSSRWSESFKDYLECALAWEVCERLTNSMSKRDRIERDMMMALKSAKSQDGMNDGVKFLPGGLWSTARRGSMGRYKG